MKYTIALINTDTGQPLAGTALRAALLPHAGWAVYEEGQTQPVQVFAGDCAGELLAKKEAAGRGLEAIDLEKEKAASPLLAAFAQNRWKAVLISAGQLGLLDEIIKMDAASFEFFVQAFCRQCTRELYLAGIARTVLAAVRDELRKQAAYNYPYVRPSR